MTDYYYESESERSEADDDGRRSPRRYPDESAPAGVDDAVRYAVAGYEDDPYYDEDPEAYPVEEMTNPPGADDGGWDEATGPGYADDGEVYEAEEIEPAAPPARTSVAAAGAAATRRIRFDPTQERGQAHFDRARQHSRTVSRLKIILPSAAVIGVLGFVAFVQFAPGPDTAIISLSGIDVDTNSVTMDKPHISGFEGTRRAYEVGADRAVQDLQNPKLAKMDQIDARIGMGNGETAHILATAGDYDGEADKMVLSDGIVINTTAGHTARLETANIDIELGTMFSSDPVEIKTGEIQINANAVEVQDEGRHVWFRNGVRVIYTPPKKAAGDEGAAAADQPAVEQINAGGPS